MKILKLLGFVLIMVLASVGVGVSGAILPSFRKQENANVNNVELVETKEEETDMSVLDQS